MIETTAGRVKRNRLRGWTWIVPAFVVILFVGVVVGQAILPFASFSSNQNSSSISTGDTIYAGAVKADVRSAVGPGSCVTPDSTVTSSLRTSEVWVPGNSTASCPATRNYYEVLTLSASALTPGTNYTDNVTVGSTVGGIVTLTTFTFTLNLNDGDTEKLSVYVDYGTSVPYFSDLSVTVSGS